MSEIEKLKKRISNATKNASEYKMTISEAKKLIEEFDILEDKIKKLTESINQQNKTTLPQLTPRTTIIDCGTL